MRKLTRRRFLNGVLLPAAVGTLPGCAVQSKAPDAGGANAPPDIIDTNVHVFDWPFRKLKYAGVKALVAKLRRHRITQAWAGSSTGLNLLKLAMLMRYSFMTGIALVAFVPLGLYVYPSLLRSLFVLQGPLQLVLVAGVSLIAAISVVSEITMIEENACAFELQKVWPEDGLKCSSLQVVALLALGLPIPVTCLVISMEEGTSVWVGDWLAWSGALVAGMLVTTIAILGMGAVQAIILPRDSYSVSLFPFTKELHDWMFSLLGRSYGHRFGKLRRWFCMLWRWFSMRGHAQMITGFAGAFLCYTGLYIAAIGQWTVGHWVLNWPPVFFVVMILMLIGFLLQELALALNPYRVPVLLLVGLWVFLVYWINGMDHYFDLQPYRSAPAPTLAEAARAWKVPMSKGHRTLVVVTASGGGIQAVAWTARVLVGLHERYQEPFACSLRLISAVSGGSVGTMYVLDRWQETPDGPALPDDAVAFDGDRPAPKSICERAMASSLEGTTWGLAFPDLLRVLTPFLVNKTDDRGARIEEVWRARLRHQDVQLTDWAPRVLDGSLPVAVFNATIVETGQRMLCSPVVGPTGGSGPSKARQLLKFFPDAHPYVTTVVRLSATFPYASPMCRPLDVNPPYWPDRKTYHFCDGGYVDNEGMVTVINWLDQLLDNDYLGVQERRTLFDRVLLVRVMPFPPEAHAVSAAPDKGWLYSFLGPIEALENVRTASQVERNNLAVKLFKAAHPDVPLSDAIFYFSRATDESGQRDDTPLSWMLTTRQKKAIESAWQDLVHERSKCLGTADSPLAIMDEHFEPLDKGSGSKCAKTRSDPAGGW
jgi:hypothetical protein